MNETYKKSAAGNEAMAKRDPRLTQQLRSTLIMIDGNRSMGDLTKFAAAFGDVGLLCQQLLGWGFIELVGGAAPAVLPTLAPTGTQGLATAVATPEVAASSGSAGTPHARALTVAELPGAVRAAVRILTSALGPHAESVALKMEKCKTVSEFEALCKTAGHMLKDFRKLDAWAQLDALVSGQ